VVITGGPGVGKSSTVAVLIKILKASCFEVCTCAPTGRAAERINECLGELGKNEDTRARTIHSMHGQIERGELKPEAIVIDELSMVDLDTVQMALTGKSIRFVVFCGDPNQLQSIGPGAVLRDIINSNQSSKITLSTIYRQGEGSQIVHSSKEIVAGTLPLKECEGDFNIAFHVDIELAIAQCAEKLKSESKVQMLSNTRAVCNECNKALQAIMNPPSDNKAYIEGNYEVIWREGDVVMNSVNNYEHAGQCLPNGACGIITHIEPDKKKIVVKFDCKITHEYEYSVGMSLMHAWCVTVWKFQGSETDHVIILLSSQWQLSRELLNTAITRAQKTCALYLTRDILRESLAIKTKDDRSTRLKERLIEVFAK
jgi:exodeoxyribonuclease V alpha subunit